MQIEFTVMKISDENEYYKIRSMKSYLFIILLISTFFFVQQASAQNSSVAIGDATPKSNAVLYLKSPGGNQGLIIPVVGSNGSFGEAGMIVYNSGDQKVYFHNGSAWAALGGASGGGSYTLSISGNSLILKDGTTTVSTVPISSSAPTANQLLMWDGTKWIATSLSQDISNASGAITVNGIKGKTLPALPSTAQALVYNGTAWVFQALAGGVTNVATGTGLTGGPITTTGTISVDVGTTANKIVQLDGTGKLPAIDGSQLTNLPAGSGDITSVTAGTGLLGGATTGAATLNVDVGVTANKIVQLDGTGKLPAVDGSQLTNLPAGTETDPTVKAINGLVKSNGTTISAATAGTDYLTPTGSAAGLTGITTAQIPSLDAAKITTGTFTTTQIPNLDAAKITSGTLATARLDVGTTANKIVQLDATGKLPAVDGSQLTNLAGGGDITGVTAGTGLTGGAASGTATLNVDVGTTANKIVQLDGTGKLPAVDGSQLTNLPAGTETDPTVKAINGLVKSNGTTLGAVVSGTDIKTINATSLLGSGNITVVAAETDPAVKAITGLVKSNGTTIGAAVAGTDYVATETDPAVKSINGLVKSNGTTISAATAGTDYLTPTGSAAGLTGITASQIPNLDAAKITSGTLATARIDVGTTANKIVQLDGTGKLPAVDGSQLTNLAGGGDITGVTAGTGLTGGAASGTATLNVDVGTTANKIVQLDGTGKLPAVDGSQLTNLAGGGDITGVTAGTGLTGGAASGTATLNVDVGTTANKIVQLDGTGKLPAIDGSQLTNLPVGTETDPTVKAINGLVKSNGTVVSAATAGTDYLTPTGNASGLTGITAAQIPNLDAAKITTGTLSTARIDVGTTANKIVQLDATGKLPAVDGSQLTNLPLGTETDPTVKAINGLVKSNGTTIGTVVSGTDIKTINATSLLGSGNITVVATETDPAVKAINGLVKSNGTTISAATEGTDYLAPNGNGSALTSLDATNISSGTLAIANGGTGATTAPLARTALGLGTLSTLSAVSTTEITNGTITDVDINGTAAIAGSKITPTFGSQNITTTGTLTTGTAGAFSVNATGNITKINNVTTSFPVANSVGVLTNDGAGALTWVAGGSSWGLTGNATTNPATNYVGTSDSQPLVFRTNAVEAMRVLTNGRVGIGTTTPVAGLNVISNGTTDVSDQAYGVRSVATGANVPANATTYGLSGVANGTNGLYAFGVHGSASGAGGGNFAGYFDGDTHISGALSVGGPSLGVFGTPGQVLTSNGSGPVTWQNPAGGGWGLTGNLGTTLGTNFIGTTDNVGLSFKTNNLQRMTIDNAGRVKIDINNTNPAPVAAGAVLDLVPNGAGIGNFILRGSFANQNDPADIEFKTWDGATELGRIFMNPSAADMRFSTNGTTRLTLRNNGNIGIGTTTPNAPLQFASTGGNRKIVLFEAANNDHEFIGFGIDGSGALRYQTAVNSNDHIFYTAASSTTSNELMRITGTGNVGIGTISPSQKLDVNGSVNIATTGVLNFGGVPVLNTNGTGGNDVYANIRVLRNASSTSADGMYIGYGNTGGAAGDLKFYANGTTERMRISAGNGYVGIGTGAPGVPLDISASVSLNDPSLTFFNDGNGGGLSVNENRTPDISVRATGGFLSTGVGFGGGFYVVSDERIKRKVGVSNSQIDLSTLMRLKVTDYKFVDSLNVGNVQVKGVFAQEVEAVYPQAISKQTNFIPSIYSVADGLSFDEANQTLRIMMAKAHGLIIGDKVKLISSTSGEKPGIVTTVDGNSFTVANWTEKTDKLFVFGKEVNDFRIVDYDRLFTLNLSATQELFKMIDDQKKMIDMMKTQEEESKKKIAVLEASLSKVAAGEAELSNLKSEIEKIKEALGLTTEAHLTKKEDTKNN